MKHLILIAALLVPGIAQAATQGCNKLANIYATTMDVRASGVPAYQLRQRIADGQHAPSWAANLNQIVTTVYNMPPEWLDGSGRADILSNIHNICLQQ